MGTFQAAFEIGDQQGQTWETIKALVDTGSSYTWIPRQILERLEVRPQFQREFETADGRVVLRDMANTMVRWNGETMPTLVVFGGDSDAVLLGAYTLEGFALAADPVNRRLVRVRGLAMGTPVVDSCAAYSISRCRPRRGRVLSPLGVCRSQRRVKHPAGKQ